MPDNGRIISQRKNSGTPPKGSGADYENMADQAAFFELQDADREAGIIPPGTVVQRVTRWF
jgi:hypothetical protein